MTECKNSFEEFLLKEYNNIAQAHFKTSETISEFFKHYITIVTIPIPIIAILLNLDFVKRALESPTPIDQLFIYLVALIFLVISIAGFLVMVYIFNLRWDALLYARTVNSIRKYFFDQNTSLDLKTKLKIRVLPQSPLIPNYFEFNYFGSVVLTFAVFNTLYSYIAYLLFFLPNSINPLTKNIVTWVFFIALIIIHFMVYRFLSNQREDKYLQSNSIGVDIDGVLNLHRTQFCQILNNQTGKVIEPDQLDKLPVRYCESLGVTKDDEINVFNDPNYWTQMPLSPDSNSVLQSIKNSLQMKIYIFTSRPWPERNNVDSKAWRILKNNWVTAAKKYESKYLNKLGLKSKVLYRLSTVYGGNKNGQGILNLFSKASPMVKITRVWLSENNIPYNLLMVERGSENLSVPSSKVYNRFYYSKHLLIKYFIEDDLLKAEKLSFICDVVFLIDHPYNKNENLPINVIRVNSFKEIYELLKLYS